MIKKRLKIQYVLILTGILLILQLLIAVTFVKTNLNDVPVVESDYIPEEVINDYIPVVNTTTRIIPPYTNQKVTVAKSYYDYKADESSQINSILQYDNTYTQNTGIDYVAEDSFEVIAILNGTIANIREDDMNGKTIEIKHDNGYVSIYQSLKDINVKKGEIVSQGQIIGTSGTNELEKDLGNHLHFEIYDKGQSVNPANYYNKEVSLEKGN